MMSSEIDKYLDTLCGYIFDEDKLVTYKWLSKELGLHVNLAKQILWQFWNEHDRRKDTSATFALMGYLAKNDMLRVEVAKEEDLPVAKSKFRKLTAEHVYSLHRSRLLDLEVLALTGQGDHRQAAILCKEIVPRTGEELHVLRWGSRLIPPTSGLGKNSLNDNSKKDSSLFGRGVKRQGSEDPEMISKKMKRVLDFENETSMNGNEENNPGGEKETPEIEAVVKGKNVAAVSKVDRKQASLLNFFKKS